MNLVSKLRERIAETAHGAEQAASGAAAKAEEAAKVAAAKVKGEARRIVADPPAPSAASIAHAARAAVDAARNAALAETKKGAPGTPGKSHGGVFVGLGASGAAGGDVGVGGEVSAGYVLGANGEAKTYGTTGVVSGSAGAVAGAGLEVGVIVGDVRNFYGDGYQLSLCPPGTVSLNLAFTRDKELTAISVAAGKSTGAGVFHFDTHTEDTTGR